MLVQFLIVFCIATTLCLIITTALALFYFRSLTIYRKKEKALSFQATHNLLTKLPNRSLLLNYIDQAIAHTKQAKQLIALLSINLDRFNLINDSLGHDAGNILIEKIALRLKDCIRASDTLAHPGGDTFIILLPNLINEKTTIKIIHKIRNQLASLFMIDGHTIFVTAGIGISFFPRDGNNATELLKNAEAAMHSAKKLGKNIFQFYTNEINNHLLSEIEFENDLRNALTKNEFFLQYQPLIDLKTGLATGAETLLRWKSPRYGTVSPLKFIPLAEETGLILPIGEWVLSMACKQASLWNTNYCPLKIAINFSALQFKQTDMIKTLVKILKETNCQGNYIEIELTESVLMADTKDVINKIQALKELGISISIDDFGTGYSNLNYLKKFPINKIKIDKSFIDGIGINADDMAITRTIISLAKNLNLRVLAEGIENENQLNYLCANECDDGQGYIFGEPTDANTCINKIISNKLFFRNSDNGFIVTGES